MLQAHKERETKLPIWAKQLLCNLRETITEQGNALAVYRKETVGKGRITVSEGMGEEINLPDHCTVSFGKDHQKIQVCYVEDRVRVYSRGNLTVEPRAANAIYMRSK